MSKWYHDVVSSINNIPRTVAFFEGELKVARTELDMSVKTLEFHSKTLPGITEHRFAQLQEVEAILEYLNIEHKKIRNKAFRSYLYNFEKTLSSRDADKFTDGDDTVIASAMLVNEVALLRNKYLAYHKGLEAKHWQLSNIVKLRCAGLEEVSI